MRNAAGLLAGLDVLDFEVATVGDDVDRFDPENFAGRLGGLRQQSHVDDLVGHRLLDDHLVLRVDRDLRVVAHADLRMRGHGAAVGIGQRDLVLAGPVKLGQHRRVTAALLRKASIFSARFFVRAPPADAPSSMSLASSRAR